MSSYIAARLRRDVRSRTGGVCEYCLIHERDTFFGCQIDHIIGEKHGGQTVLENLALACTICNRAKGSDVGSVDPATLEFVRFYNPRVDAWKDHFEIRGDEIVAKSRIGDVTARLLGFNVAERRLERAALIATLRYPPPEAVHLTDPGNSA